MLQVFFSCGLVMFLHKMHEFLKCVDPGISLLGEEVSVSNKLDLGVFKLIIDLELIAQKLTQG